MRIYSFYTMSFPTQLASPDPSRFEVFGSLGDDMNNTIVRNQSGAAWNSATVVYITTPNQKLGDALVASATASRLNPQSMFIEPVGSNIITGINATADDSAH